MQPKYRNKESELKLPQAISTYLAAVKTRDASMLDLCFAADAVVRDEHEEHRGVDAIKSWKKEAEAKYRYIMEPLDILANGDTVKLCAKVTGDFPGSPIELDYVFTLANDKITSLEIQ